ncbi:MAG: hypothetical protein ACLFUB_21640 [Cyclobacteriaceae bacterium]
MLIDRYKQPIGYKLYAGNTFEGHTYQDMVAALKKEYQIERIVLVADRGMMNKDNLKVVREQGYEFVPAWNAWEKGSSLCLPRYSKSCSAWMITSMNGSALLPNL